MFEQDVLQIMEEELHRDLLGLSGWPANLEEMSDTLELERLLGLLTTRKMLVLVLSLGLSDYAEHNLAEINRRCKMDDVLNVQRPWIGRALYQVITKDKPFPVEAIAFALDMSSATVRAYKMYALRQMQELALGLKGERL